jgi:hypothetical protein
MVKSFIYNDIPWLLSGIASIFIARKAKTYQIAFLLLSGVWSVFVFKAGPYGLDRQNGCDACDDCSSMVLRSRRHNGREVDGLKTLEPTDFRARPIRHARFGSYTEF